ncbi:MAG: hypothetical protein H8D87_03795 [Deltaproteobacteria bacterium]|nr:hypothetical protein [Candidatus Desulfobacula maris]
MFSKDILERAEKREARSRDHEKRYESGDEKALREFCRIDPFAIKTPWVQKAIEKALMTGYLKPLENLFTTGKREKKNPITEKTQDLIIKETVNQVARETGLPKMNPKYGTSVYDKIYDDQILTFGTAQEMSPKTILNRCTMANNQSADIMIENVMGGTIVRCGPAVQTMEGKPIFGIFEIFFPSDGGEPYFNANGVFNIPTGKDKYDMLPESWKKPTS